MKHRYIYLLFILLFTGMVSCEHEFPGSDSDVKPKKSDGSVILLKSGRTDNIISLSVNAPTLERFGVWIDLDGNGTRAEDGTENIKVFNAYQEYILSEKVSEIAVYGNITYLAVASNKLLQIDVSGNTHLTTLNVPQNSLGAIDLSKNKQLTRLDVSGNNIHILDITNNTQLISLWCFNNELRELNLVNNTVLSFLNCSGNQLTLLDISKNTRLTRLLAYNNQLRTIDISNNTLLNRVWLFDNQLSEPEIEHLASTLNSAVNGDIWISKGSINEKLRINMADKGWAVNSNQ